MILAALAPEKHLPGTLLSSKNLKHLFKFYA